MNIEQEFLLKELKHLSKKSLIDLDRYYETALDVLKLEKEESGCLADYLLYEEKVTLEQLKEQLNNESP